jgi:hypothetical protein
MIDMFRFTRFIAVVAVAATTVSCGTVGTSRGRGSSFVVIDSLQGIRGAASIGSPASTLISDVITNVVSPAPCSAAAPCPTVFGDNGQAAMHIAMKDAGSATPTTPTELQNITLSRYRVVYTRSDGRNTPGVDVPQPFDGFVTVTVTPGGTSFAFSLVRVQAKQEPPLVLLKNPLSGTITEFAAVTFYGTDQTGAEVSVTGTIQIDFGNFGDL